MLILFGQIMWFGIQCLQHDKSTIKFRTSSPQDTEKFSKKEVLEGGKIK